MKAIKINNEIKVYGNLPKTWKNILNFQKADKKMLKEQGFYDVVKPKYDLVTQKLGAIYWDKMNEVFTYPIINKTSKEIKAEKPPVLLTEDDLTESDLRELTLQMLKDFRYIKKTKKFKMK